jgi:hypothetical protein
MIKLNLTAKKNAIFRVRRQLHLFVADGPRLFPVVHFRHVVTDAKEQELPVGEVSDCRKLCGHFGSHFVVTN